MSLDIRRDSYQPGGGAHASQRHESSHDSARPAVINEPVATVFEPRQRSEGTAYPSLSAIARAITGTSWSGPRFFALQGKGSKSRCSDGRNSTYRLVQISATGSYCPA
jgi:hypothetical protein